MKSDFRKTMESYKASPGTFVVVDVPPIRYLMVDGHGDPNLSNDFTCAVNTLYPLAYALKFASKNELGRDYVVMPLEGQWWAPNMDVFTRDLDKSAWRWTLLMMVPSWMTPAMFDAAVAKVADRNPSLDVSQVRLELLNEGKCVQTLHIGSFEEESQVLADMHNDFIPAHNLRMLGRHHEIYFSDFRKTDPSKLKTILRQPVISG